MAKGERDKQSLFWTPSYAGEEPPWEVETCDRGFAEIWGMELEEYRELRDMASKLPGKEHPNPKEKIWRYLIAEYGFDPQTLSQMTRRDMRRYIEARPPDHFKGQPVPLTATPKGIHGQAVKRDAKAEARDSWLYRKASKKNPPTWKALMAELNRVAAERRWTKLSSVQGVKQAVDRYIQRNNLAPLPPRKEA